MNIKDWIMINFLGKTRVIMLTYWKLLEAEKVKLLAYIYSLSNLWQVQIWVARSKTKGHLNFNFNHTPCCSRNRASETTV